MTRAVLAAAALLVAAACAARPADEGRHVPTATPIPVSSPLLVSDSGGTFTAGPHASVLVRLAGRGWQPLTVSAGSVEEVYYRTDPGYREWQVTMPAAGKVTLASSCESCALPRFRVVVIVGATGDRRLQR